MLPLLPLVADAPTVKGVATTIDQLAGDEAAQSVTPLRVT